MNLQFPAFFCPIPVFFRLAGKGNIVYNIKMEREEERYAGSI